MESTVRRTLFVAAILLAMPVQAQAPAEERQVSVIPVEASQQRLTSLRRQVEAAEESARQAQQESREAKSRLDDARARDASATKSLQAARQEHARAQKAFQEEAVALEALRRGATPMGSVGGAPTAKP